jgi:repressor LexA
LGVITKYIADNGYAPTIRELGGLIDCSSPNGVMCHLTALVKKGLITWKRGHARTICVVEQKG